MTMGNGKCECCWRERELVGVASSTAGPMSIAWCRECLDNHAEPKWMLEYLIEQDNWRIHDPEYRIAVTFFENGSYHPFLEFIQEYKRAKASLDLDPFMH